MINKITLCTLLLFITRGEAGPWSRYIVSQNRDDVTISFRQQRNHNGWVVEWQVKNDSSDKVEPFLKKRNYICKDNRTQNMGAISLGVYQALQQRHGDVVDVNICPNSTIKLVEIETEIKVDEINHD